MGSFKVEFKIASSFHTVKNGSGEKGDMEQNKNSEENWNEHRMNGRSRNTQ